MGGSILPQFDQYLVIYTSFQLFNSDFNLKTLTSLMPCTFKSWQK